MEDIARGGRTRRWVRWAALVPAAALLVALAIVTAARSDTAAVGEAAPAFSAPRLGGGGMISLHDFRGKPVVVNFWASWCAPCRDEAPLLQEAFERHGRDIAFVGVDIRDAESDALAFVREHGIGYPSVRDEDLAIYSDYGLTGQPETFFIDHEGVVVEHVPGPVFADDLARMIDVLLARRG